MYSSQNGKKCVLQMKSAMDNLLLVSAISKKESFSPTKYTFNSYLNPV